MSFPSRLKSATRPITKAASVITPTGIGVLLSIGAHALLLAFGPQTNFSFAALTQAAQEAEAEETIVPLMELSPAEQGRLPDFAQPRRQPPSLTGLSSLALPSGIPFNPGSSIRRPPVAANKIPSPTNRPFTGGNIGSLRNTIPNSFPLDILRNSNLRGTPVPQPSASSTPPAATYVPLPPSPAPATRDPLNPNQAAGNSLPELSPPAGTEDTLTTAELLENLQAAGTSPNPNGEDISPEPESTDEGTGEAQEIPIETESIDLAAAQGDGAQIVEDSNEYSDEAISDAEVAQRTANWYAATAEGKDQVAQATSELTIDSDFKACRENPPIDGLLGVLVNPDGTQENAAVLKSSGYDVLNRLALRTLEYQDFGEPELPTQYEVVFKVIYEPEGCVEETPEETPEEAPQ